MRSRLGAERMSHRRLRGALRYFRERRHTTLLGAIVAAFAVRALIGDHAIAPVAFSLAMVVVLLLALLTIQSDELQGDLSHRKWRNGLGLALAAVAFSERLLLPVVADSRLFTVAAITWCIFFAFVTWSLLHSVLKQRIVTGETISNAISVYLLAGISWGLLYDVIFQTNPAAFVFGASGTPDRQHSFPELVYFSLTTLATIGFGDITPVTLQARYAAVAEGIAGQFYLAILVARLVSMQMSLPR